MRCPFFNQERSAERLADVSEDSSAPLNQGAEVRVA